MKKYSENTALKKALKNSKAELEIIREDQNYLYSNIIAKVLYVKRGTAGIGTLGAISFLSNYCYYTIQFY